MTADNESEDARWIARLEGGELSGVLREIASLPDERRRAAIADPGPYLDRAGLRPPQNAQVSLREQSFDDVGAPPGLDFPVKFEFLICFEICVWRTNLEGFVRRCWYECIRV